MIRFNHNNHDESNRKCRKGQLLTDRISYLCITGVDLLYSILLCLKPRSHYTR